MTDTVNRVILDLDIGTDDAMALLLFLYGMKLGILKIEAIICSRGNTSRDHVVKNVVRLLELTNRTDIPVYKGSVDSLIPPPEFLMYHGKDGFGDLDHDNEPDISMVRDTPAVVAMHDLVINNPKEITIIGLAALTNIALAHKVYEDFLPNVKEIWIMGGNYKGIGNTQGTGEFNFFIDPEAAFIILNNAYHKINMLPWETCSSSTIPRNWRFDVLGKSTYPALELLTKAERIVHKSHEEVWKCCDGQLAACYLFPDRAIAAQKDYKASVELNGAITRGQVTINRKAEEFNVRIIEEVNYQTYQEILLDMADVLNS